jgi:hypothetical protein
VFVFYQVATRLALQVDCRSTTLCRVVNKLGTFSCAESYCRRYGKISETDLDVELNCAVPNCEDTVLDIFTMLTYDNHIIILKNDYGIGWAHEKHGV